LYKLNYKHKFIFFVVGSLIHFLKIVKYQKGAEKNSYDILIEKISVPFFSFLDHEKKVPKIKFHMKN